MFAEPWTPSARTATPRGFKEQKNAVHAFPCAVAGTARCYRSYDMVRSECTASALPETPTIGPQSDQDCGHRPLPRRRVAEFAQRAAPATVSTDRTS
jgi:hypothetical protein